MASSSDTETAGWRPKLVLASASPRRLALLQQAGIEPDAPRHLEGGELTVTLWRGIKTAALDRKAA